MNFRWILALFLTSSLLLPICAQNPQQKPKSDDDEVVRITTNLVQVDAVVTDKSGKIVTDLKPEDFVVSEDGKEQKITNFSYIQLETPVASAPAPSSAKPTDKAAPPVPPAMIKPESVRRTIALVVDDLGLSFESTYHAREALKKFVNQQVQQGDLVAIIRTAGGIGALQQFTTDKRQLYAAIEKIRWYPNGRGGVGVFAPISSSGNNNSNNENDPTGQNSKDGASADQDLEDFRNDVFAVGTLGALGYVVRGLQELPGRKAVVLFSDGIKITNREDPSKSDRVLTAMRSLVEQANRASVVVYTIDTRGLVYTGLTAEDDTSNMNQQQLTAAMSRRNDELFYGQEGLNFLARETGGIPIRNSNNLSGGLAKVLEDQKGYYLIGYKPDASTFDPVTGRRKFHRLAIKVKRTGLNVRTRSGFLGVSDENKRPVYKTPQQQMAMALTSPFGESGVNVRLTSLFGNDQKAGSFIRSLLHVKATDLTFTDEADGWKKAVFDILEVTFGDNGVPVEQISRTHTIRARDETFKRFKEDGFNYILTFPIKKAGAYQLRAAIRDTASERVGSASQFIEIPDVKKNRLALSGIIVQGYDQTALKKVADAGVKPAADGEEPQGDPKASASVRQFKRGMGLQYGYVIFNAQSDKAQAKPQLLAQVRIFRDGRQIFTGKEIPVSNLNQTDLKRITAGGMIQLGTEMVPGDYQLQVVVTDQLANQKRRVATQWIDFQIIA
jgi:VWFA-related protein